MLVNPVGVAPKAGVVMIPKRLVADPAALHSARFFAASGFACEVRELSRVPKRIQDLSSGELLEAAAQVRMAVITLRRQLNGAKVGMVGAWVGGSIALLASDCSADACAVVCPHVRLPFGMGAEVLEPLDAAGKARMPVLAVFGELDADIPLEDVRALERVLNNTEGEDQSYTYPGVGHSFFDNEPGNREYREAAERDLWQRIERFFEATMG